MVTHVLYGMLNAGALDESVCTAGCDCEHYLYGVTATSDAHVALARTIASHAAILLKNDGDVLPLPPSATVAVVGSACGATHSIDVEKDDWKTGDYYVVGGSGRVVAASAVSTLAALQAAGIATVVSPTDDVAPALHAASQAAYVLVCASGTTSEDQDRPTLRLDQHSLLTQLSSARADGSLGSAKLIVAAMAPGAIAVSPWKDGADAIMAMFLGGQESGHGWADALLGHVNPDAKLPVTFVNDDDDEHPPGPCVGSASLHCEYAEGLSVAWRGLHNESVGFPFGHGLSYTTFTYEWAAMPIASADAHAALQMQVTVTNAGSGHSGAEVVQLYVRYPPHAGEPPSGVLRAFEKTRVLAPGEAQTLTFTLRDKDLSIWDSTPGAWSRVAGAFTMAVGSSSRDIRLTHTAQVR